MVHSKQPLHVIQMDHIPLVVEKQTKHCKKFRSFIFVNLIYSKVSNVLSQVLSGFKWKNSFLRKYFFHQFKSNSNHINYKICNSKYEILRKIKLVVYDYFSPHNMKLNCRIIEKQYHEKKFKRQYQIVNTRKGNAIISQQPQKKIRL